MKYSSETVNTDARIPERQWDTDTPFILNGHDGPEWAERVFPYRGLIVLGEDGAGVSIEENVYSGPGHAESYARICFEPDKGFDGCSVESAPLVAAAFAFAAVMYEGNTPEPTDAQLEMLAATIKGQAADILARHKTTNTDQKENK